MTLRVAIIRDGLLETGGLEALLRDGGAATAPSSEPPPEPDPTADLVLLDQGLLSRHGSSFVDLVRERHPAALVCLLAQFARRKPLADALPAGIWDILYLPAQSDEVEALLARTAALVARRVRAARPRAILIVDDEASIRESTASLLSQRGYRVETAVDALEAIGRLRLRQFDLVVTDLQMPGMDGLAMLDRIHQAYPQLPVVIVSGQATVETAIAALRTGAVDFIRKPFGAQEFVQVVERGLRFSDLSRENLELEAQAREEKARLRERQYELRVLATGIAEMSRAVRPAEVAECWLRASGEVLGFVGAAFLLLQPEPELVLFDRGSEASLPERSLALLAAQAPGLVAGISLERLQLRHVVGVRRVEGTVRGGGAAAAQVHVLGPATNPCAGVVLFQADGAGQTAGEESFLHSLTLPAAQVLEKLRAVAAEERLRETAMVADMRQGVILADTAGNITVMNAAARELLGLTTGEPVSNLASLSVARGIPLAAAVAELTLAGGDTLCREFPLPHPAERILTLDLTLIRGDAGTPIAVVGLLRDVTESREAERMKSEFVSIISHELRTPLTTIKTCNSLLLGGSTGEITPPQERFLRMAQVSIDRIVRLADDLLDVERIQSGRLRLEFTTVDLSVLLREVGNEAEPVLLERGLRLAYGGLDLPLPICADRDRLKQVFLNLVHNAVKYSPAGGVIEVRAGAVSAAGLPEAVRPRLRSPEGPLVEVQVLDEGSGIAPEEAGGIFERFQQIEPTLCREQGGVGLGLPISRGIVRSHGGEVWAERREAAGSVLRVILPREGAPGCGPGD